MTLAKFLIKRVGFNNETVPPPPPAVPPTPTPPGRQKPEFTPEQQAWINDQVGIERRKASEKLQTELEALKGRQGTTAEEKAQLEAQIEDLKKQYLTKEELAADEWKKKESKFNNDLKTVTEQAQTWEKTFKESLIHNEILKAAGDPEAEVYDSEQILEMLSHKAKVVPVVDDETGKVVPNKFAVKIPLTIDGKALEFTPKEALSKMKEMPKYANQFKSKIKSGLGGNNSGDSSGEQDYKNAANSADSWAIARKQLGLDKIT